MKIAEYTIPEMKKLLDSLGGMYDLARVVDPKECRVLTLGSEGSLRTGTAVTASGSRTSGVSTAPAPPPAVAGFIIEIDDFGNGQSSLSMLKDIQADMLKIDMDFLRETENKARSRIILGAIIRLAESLGMDVVTEGVETEA